MNLNCERNKVQDKEMAADLIPNPEYDEVAETSKSPEEETASEEERMAFFQQVRENEKHKLILAMEQERRRGEEKIKKQNEKDEIKRQSEEIFAVDNKQEADLQPKSKKEEKPSVDDLQLKNSERDSKPKILLTDDENDLEAIYLTNDIIVASDNDLRLSPGLNDIEEPPRPNLKLFCSEEDTRPMTPKIPITTNKVEPQWDIVTEFEIQAEPNKQNSMFHRVSHWLRKNFCCCKGNNDDN